MIIHEAALIYGGAQKTRKFYSFESALKWLYSHAFGQYYVDGVEYTRETIREALRSK